MIFLERFFAPDSKIVLITARIYRRNFSSIHAGVTFYVLNSVSLVGYKKVSAVKNFLPNFGTDFIYKICTVSWEVKTHILGMC